MLSRRSTIRWFSIVLTKSDYLCIRWESYPCMRRYHNNTQTLQNENTQNILKHFLFRTFLILATGLWILNFILHPRIIARHYIPIFLHDKRTIVSFYFQSACAASVLTHVHSLRPSHTTYMTKPSHNELLFHYPHCNINVI